MKELKRLWFGMQDVDLSILLSTGIRQCTLRIELSPFYWHLRAYHMKPEAYGLGALGLRLGPLEIEVTW